MSTNTLLNFFNRIELLNKEHKGFPLMLECAKVMQRLSLEEIKSLITEGLEPFLAKQSNYRADVDPNNFVSVPISKRFKSIFPNIHFSLHLFPSKTDRIGNTGEPHYHPHGDAFISRTLNGSITHSFVTPRANENGTHQCYYRSFDSHKKAGSDGVTQLGRFNLIPATKEVTYSPISSEQSRVRELCLMSTSPVHEVTTDEQNYTATLMLTPTRTAIGQRVYLPYNKNYEQILPSNKQVIQPPALRQIISRNAFFNS